MTTDIKWLNDYDRDIDQLNLEEIRKNPAKQDWWGISFRFNLPENFIREFQSYIYWDTVSRVQTLSENLIRDFQDKVYWLGICRYQKLSKEFIIEFIDRIDFCSLIVNNKISNEVKDYCRMFV